MGDMNIKTVVTIPMNCDTSRRNTLALTKPAHAQDQDDEGQDYDREKQYGCVRHAIEDQIEDDPHSQADKQMKKAEPKATHGRISKGKTTFFT